MKDHSTKTANAQQAKSNSSSKQNKEETMDLIESTDAAARFLNRFKIVKLLGECGAYKEKGVPIKVILLYIFNLTRINRKSLFKPHET